MTTKNNGTKSFSQTKFLCITYSNKYKQIQTTKATQEHTHTNTHKQINVQTKTQTNKSVTIQADNEP